MQEAYEQGRKCGYDAGLEYKQNYADMACKQLLEKERERCKKIIEDTKLPIPNPYGTTVNLKRFNEVLDEIKSKI